MSTFTIDALRDAQRKLEALGPAPFWASHSLLPADTAYKFTFRNVEYVGSHPDFWAKLAADPRVQVGFDFSPLSSITIRNLDVDAAARQQFYEALAGAFASGHAA